MEFDCICPDHCLFIYLANRSSRKTGFLMTWLISDDIFIADTRISRQDHSVKIRYVLCQRLFVSTNTLIYIIRFD